MRALMYSWCSTRQSPTPRADFLGHSLCSSYSSWSFLPRCLATSHGLTLFFLRVSAGAFPLRFLEVMTFGRLVFDSIV